MKNRTLILSMIVLSIVGTVRAQVLPTYLDETKDIEERIEDALSRMTLDEKIAVIHAQSKFSSPGVKRLGFPDFWTDERLMCRLPRFDMSCRNMESTNVKTLW